MNRHGTLRSQLLTLMAALVVMMALYGLRFNPLLMPPSELAGSSWSLTDGSKMPAASSHLAATAHLNAATPIFVWSSGTHKVYRIETLAAGQHTMLQGVPWATDGGSKTPTFGFVTPSVNLEL